MDAMAQFGYVGHLEPWACYMYGVIMLMAAFGLGLNLKKPKKSEK